MKLNFFAAATVLSALTLSLTACSAAQPPVATSPTPSATSSATQKPLVLTPEQALAAYKILAENSCNAAQSLGIVEKAGDITIVSVNKNQGYHGYSAAYLEKPDKYDLIWELSSISACADWYTLSMAAEAGKDAGIKVTYDGTDKSYTVTQDLGEFGISKFKYTTFDAKIATAENLDPKYPGIITMRYGNITPAERDILIQAVLQYEAANK